MLISLDRLQPHPSNANVMPEHRLAKLQMHIRDSGRYPPLIVRPLPGDDAGGAERYEILDGHHRAIVLRRLGWPSANCEVWPDIDDQRAGLLLLTLNRLQGTDDPHRRGALLALVRERLPAESLARLLPDDQQRIERLIAMTRPPAAGDLPAPSDLPPAPLAVTFFLPEPQHRRLLQRLRTIDRDRNQALARALSLDQA
jgi:ParB-like chromosome segregation protein Spo0J